MAEHLHYPLDSINRQMKSLDSLYHKAALSFGLSDSSFWALYALLESDREYAQQDLCEILSLPKQTLNTTVSSIRRVAQGGVWDARFDNATSGIDKLNSGMYARNSSEG